jgi:Na+/H+ antiporter NhaD/arsenite permease-like protein
MTILLCRRLALPIVPYLLAEIFASNIGGTATPVGDPPTSPYVAGVSPVIADQQQAA